MIHEFRCSHLHCLIYFNFTVTNASVSIAKHGNRAQCVLISDTTGDSASVHQEHSTVIIYWGSPVRYPRAPNTDLTVPTSAGFFPLY